MNTKAPPRHCLMGRIKVSRTAVSTVSAGRPHTSGDITVAARCDNQTLRRHVSWLVYDIIVDNKKGQREAANRGPQVRMCLRAAIPRKWFGTDVCVHSGEPLLLLDTHLHDLPRRECGCRMVRGWPPGAVTCLTSETPSSDWSSCSVLNFLSVSAALFCYLSRSVSALGRMSTFTFHCLLKLNLLQLWQPSKHLLHHRSPPSCLCNSCLIKIQWILNFRHDVMIPVNSTEPSHIEQISFKQRSLCLLHSFISEGALPDVIGCLQPAQWSFSALCCLHSGHCRSSV